MPRYQIGRFSLLFVVAIVVGALMPTILNIAVQGGSLHDISRWFGPNVLISASIGGLSWIILSRWGRYLATRRAPFNWLAIVAVLLTIAATGLLLAFSILAAAGKVDGDFWPTYLEALRLASVITLMIGSGVFFYETFKSRLDESARELEAKRQEAEHSRQAAVAARLASLESRVHPHFLFNTLNSISALIREDPARAEKLVERLSALLRFSLDSNQASLTPLRRELKIVTDYLEIERARFGERLLFSINAPDALLDAEVPPMSVQTLVENCVKHAVSPRREGGRIDITAHESDGQLEIEVSDDGPGFSEHGFAQGHGLDTLQSRLNAQFGERGRLAVARQDGRTVVSMLLPATGVRV